MGEVAAERDDAVQELRESIGEVETRQEAAAAAEQYDVAAALDDDLAVLQDELMAAQSNLTRHLSAFAALSDELQQNLDRERTQYEKCSQALREATDLRTRTRDDVRERASVKRKAQTDRAVESLAILEAQRRENDNEMECATCEQASVEEEVEELVRPFTGELERVGEERDAVKEEIARLQKLLQEKKMQEIELSKKSAALQSDIDRIRKEQHGRVVEARKRVNDTKWRLAEVNRKIETNKKILDGDDEDQGTRKQLDELESGLRALAVVSEDCEEMARATAGAAEEWRAACSDQPELKEFASSLTQILEGRQMQEELRKQVKELTHRVMELEDSGLAVEHELRTFEQVIPTLMQTKKRAIAGRSFAEASKLAKEIQRSEERCCELKKERTDIEAQQEQVQAELESANAKLEDMDMHLLDLEGEYENKRRLAREQFTLALKFVTDQGEEKVAASVKDAANSNPT
eukprot:TRINITY_DN5481_c0_g1_i3.p1 TRINITY_DN5481_c0_g1~~TRINITY_DN5481_c0_g1_i3.p1  ORF type:complete len:495 (-),score=159.92 TRINITY_DN5481_c0_g1_i3:1002-2396(-)